jgi:hypothetical protein
MQAGRVQQTDNMRREQGRHKRCIGPAIQACVRAAPIVWGYGKQIYSAIPPEVRPALMHTVRCVWLHMC